MSWALIAVGPREIHVIPSADLIEHARNDECICGPVTQFVDGGYQLITHASLDGREIRERPKNG